MVAGAGAVARARPRARQVAVDRAVVERLALWLLGAVALDLVVTRFLVRLAMFVPKGEPWASIGAGIGRLGAAADALVPIVGILLLGALLLRAGRRAGPVERALLVGIGVVAAGGLTLVVLPPSPAVVLGLDLLVAGLAVVAGIRAVGVARLPAVASAGLAVLAASVALAAAARAVGIAAGGSVGLAVDALGQLTFVVGAGLLGLASLAESFLRRRRTRGLLAGGSLAVVVALAVLVAGERSPLMLGALAIWSVGLAGAVPVPLVALGLGLAVAGLPALRRRAGTAAIGAGIVLLAGYGLAASGLVLAGLLGLVVAGLPVRASLAERIG